MDHRLKILLVCVLQLVPMRGFGQASFTDVTAAMGVNYSQNQLVSCIHGDCDADGSAGGAAIGDYDGDGWSDIYVTRIHDRDILFRNRVHETGVFEDVSIAAGLSGFNYQSNGAGFADIDNDGDQDLYVTTMEESQFLLFINDGAGQFTEEATARGAAVTSNLERRGFGVAFGDYDRDGYVDILTSEWAPQAVATCESGHNRLLRNIGSANPGYFVDVTYESGLTAPPGFPLYGFSPAFVDLDNDGWQDIAIAADFGTSQLFWNNRDGTFQLGTAAAGVGLDKNGMGSTFGDLDNDGDLDWFVTAIWDPAWPCECSWIGEGNFLYRNRGAKKFEDATAEYGVKAGDWGWGAAFLDFDNDGDLDIAQTNGFRIDAISDEDQYNADPNRLWRNDAGTMTEIAATSGFGDTNLGRGLMVLDYDRDGDLDIFVTTNRGPPHLYRNDGGNSQDWL
jgi:hypothetical protein